MVGDDRIGGLTAYPQFITGTPGFCETRRSDKLGNPLTADIRL